MCKQLKQAVYLDSNAPESLNNSFDIFSAEPINSFDIFSAEPINSFSYSIDTTENISSYIENSHVLSEINIKLEPLPFTHGLIGFFSYSTGEKLRQTNHHTLKNHKEENFPKSFLGFYAWSYVYNHETQKGFISFLR